METRLTIIKDAGKNKHGQRLSECVCKCGTVIVAATSRVKTGKVKSCGCLKTETTKARWAKHRARNLWDRLEKQPNGCWLWTGPVDTHGYPSIGYEGKVWRAHRLAYTLKKGPIPEGKFILHSCANKRCCNPAHLRAGTHEENMADLRKHGGRRDMLAGEDNGRAKLTQEQADKIRELYATGEYSQMKLAELYCVSQVAVSKIIRGKRYMKPLDLREPWPRPPKGLSSV